MSCIQITACQLASSPSASPVPISQLSKASITLLRTKAKIPKLSLNSTTATSESEQAPTRSPWKIIENAVGNLKKEPSVEDLLRQQIQKQEYYDDGGTPGKPPGGGGGGGGGGGDGGGFGEAEDGGFAEMWDEFSQVILATMGFIFLYIYIIEGEEITVLAKDLLRFLFKRQMSIRLKRLVEGWEDFFQSMKDKPAYDPYWLEREILSTTTMYDSPDKYAYIFKALDKIESTPDQLESPPEREAMSESGDDEQY